MKNTVLILCYSNPNNNDLYLAGLVGYLGLEYTFIKPVELIANNKIFSTSQDKSRICVAMSGETLEAVYRNESYSGLLTKLLGSISFVFLYGISPDIPANTGLTFLTDGIIQSISTFPNNNFSYSVSERNRDISRQFSGLTFGPINSQVDFVFDTGNPVKDTDTIISIDSRPMFVRIKKGTCDIFALATSKIQDINETEHGTITAAKHFSAMAPALMFLKFAFGNSCWHPIDNQACLTIDDPLLHKKYGFLNYRTLLKTMRQHGFFTTLAFIPWNFRRTQIEVADLFKNNSDTFSICVHGCDHTAGEFGIKDLGKIAHKIDLATRKMIIHQELTGLGFDKVMVFPQGVFSTASLKALKSNNYMAAVNSGVFPVDSSHSLRMLDLMQQSIMSDENFPLYHRRYPDRIADFAFDLFLGKPALIVAHHDYFRGGNERVVEFVKKINSLDTKIEWRGLGDIVRDSYWLKQESDRQVSLRICSNSLRIDNNSDITIKYLITKYEMNNVPLDGVFVNGKEFAYRLEDQFLKVEIDIQPGASADMVILYKNPHIDFKEEHKTSENMKVFLRRHLSEIRDNYISKNHIFHMLARKIVNILRK